MSDQSDGTLKNIGVFSTLQSATETKFFLLAATFILFMDNCFVGFGEPGIFDLAMSKTLLEQSNLVAKGILIFVGFSLVTSTILPFIVVPIIAIVIEVLHPVVYRVTNFFSTSRNDSQRRPDEVSASELRAEAHDTREKYYLDLLEKHEKAESQFQSDKWQCTTYSFYCLTMFIVNLCIGWDSSRSLVYALAVHAGSAHWVWLSLLLLGWMFLGYLFTNFSSPSIYCPPLYRKVMQKKHQEKQRWQEITDGRPRHTSGRTGNYEYPE